MQDASDVNIDHAVPLIDLQLVQQGKRHQAGLLTRTSSRPNRSRARLTNAARSERLVTSTAIASALPPVRSSSAARAFSLSSRRAPSTTAALRAARYRAAASPIPLLAPVIAITFPSISDIW